MTINPINCGTGTSGQVLTSNGTGIAPTFQATQVPNLGYITGNYYPMSMVPANSAATQVVTVNQSLTPGYYFAAIQAEANVTLYKGNTGTTVLYLGVGTSFARTSTASAFSYAVAYGSGLSDLSAATPTVQTGAIIMQMKIA